MHKLVSKDLKFICKEMRKNILIQMQSSGGGHIGGCLSIVELLAVLYTIHMNIDPKNPQKKDRDRLVVSKGHSGPAVYSILCYLGYFPREWLYTLNKSGTNLPSHCDMNKTPGIDMTTGSLGQGLSCAVGMALGLKIRKLSSYVYVILGDGEIQEGQIWEAAMYGSHMKLDNLMAFIDYNGLQIDGKVSEVCEIEPLGKKWEAFGWNVLCVNGHDLKEISISIEKAKKNMNNRPNMIILKTIKGFGVKISEQAGVDSHSMNLTLDIIAQAYKDVEEGN